MKQISIKKLFTLALVLCFGCGIAFAQGRVITEGWERSAKSVRSIVAHLRKKNPNVSEAVLNKVARKLYQEVKLGQTSRPKPKVEVGVSKSSIKTSTTASTQGTTPAKSPVGINSTRYGSASTLRRMGIAPVSGRKKAESSEIQDEVEAELAPEDMRGGEVDVQFERDLSRPVTAADKWLAEVQKFVEKYGRWPRSKIFGKEPSEYTPEEKEECQISNGVYSAIQSGNLDDPTIKALIEFKAQYIETMPRAIPRSPKEWLVAAQKFIDENGRYPRSNISGKKTAEYTPEEKSECQIATGVSGAIKRGDPNDPVIQALVALKAQYIKEKAVQRTPKEWLDIARDFTDKYQRWPREKIPGKDPAQYTPDEVEECQIAAGVRNAIMRGFPKDPTIQALIELKNKYIREHATPGTAAEKWLVKVQKFVEKYGRWPRQQIPGKKITEYTPAEREECQIRNGVDSVLSYWGSEDPVTKTLAALRDQYVRKKAPRKTPEELLAAAEDFVNRNGRWPRSKISGKEPSQYTEEEKAECQIANGVGNAIRNGNQDDPIIKALVEIRAQYAREKSAPGTAAEKWLSEAEKFVAEYKRWPRSTISGKKPSEYTEAEKQECQIGKLANQSISRGDPQDPTIQKLVKLRAQYLSRTPSRTPQEVLEQLQKFMDEHDGKFPVWNASSAKERSLRNAVTYVNYHGDANNSAVKRIQELCKENVFSPRTSQELMKELENFLAKEGQYPIARTSLYHAIHYRLGSSEKLPDGTYADPDTQALYEFDQLARQTRYGEKRWNEVVRPKEARPEEPGTEVVRKKRPRIGESDREEMAIEDTGHVFNFESGYAHLPAYQQDILDEAANEANMYKERFQEWVRDNYEYLNFNSKGQEALRVLESLVERKEMLPEDDVVWDILALFRQSELGPQEDGGFVRMIYDGENPRFLKSGDFYTVTEYKGRYVYDAESLPPTKHITLMWSNTENHVLEGIKLQPGVTFEEVKELFDSLLEDDWKIRMGEHELGLNGDGTTLREKDGILHVHFEGKAEFAIAGEVVEEQLVSDWINIFNAKEAIAPDAKTWAQIAKAYKNFFGKYYYKK